jgi:hypothetical protein
MLDKLLDVKQKLNNSILQCFKDDVKSIKIAAETMAECATNIKGHGYLSFINSRDEFFKKVDLLEEEITKNVERSI